MKELIIFGYLIFKKRCNCLIFNIIQQFNFYNQIILIYFFIFNIIVTKYSKV